VPRLALLVLVLVLVLVTIRRRSWEFCCVLVLLRLRAVIKALGLALGMTAADPSCHHAANHDGNFSR